MSSSRPGWVDPWAVPFAGRTGDRRPPALVAWVVAFCFAAGPAAVRHLLDGFAGRAVIVAVAAGLLLTVHYLVSSIAARVALVSVVGVAGGLLIGAGGRRSAFITLAASWAAYEIWLRARREEGGSTAVEGEYLAVPLAVLGSLVWVRAQTNDVAPGAYQVATVVAVLALSAAAWVTIAARRYRAWGVRWHRRGAGLIGALANGVAMAAVFVVAVPLLYLPGLVVRVARAVRRPESSSSWRVRETTLVEDRSVARRPFGAAARPVRNRRHVASAALVVALIAVIVAFLPTRDDGADRVPSAAEQTSVPFSSLPAYKDVEFADALQVEQKRFSNSLVEDPVTFTASPDFDGIFTHVHDGVRRTIEPSCDCPEVTVWLTGGSVAFGLGQRDEHTIASELVRRAEADGIALAVTNLAVPGWTIAQERRAVEARLEEQPPPDLIVSLTGYNDVTAALTSGAVHGFDDDLPVLLNSDDVAVFAAEGLTVDDAGGVDAVADVVSSRFELEQDALDDAAARSGTVVAYFAQPDALASPEQFEVVRSAIRGLPDRTSGDLDRSLDLTFKRLAGRGVVNLRHVFDGLPAGRSVFVDWSHTNEAGASVVADSIYRESLPQMLAAVHSR